MNKRLASALLCAALLGSGILRADNIVISNRKSSILITAPKGESPRIQYFGPRLANPGDVFDSGSAFNDPVYPQFGVQCSRETAIQATHNDGNMSLELVVESVTRENRDGGQVTAIATRDKFYPFYVTIYYKTYPDCEVIETWTEIRHLEKKPVTLYRFASAFLPVRRGDNWLSHFHGPWGAEAYLYEEALTDGMRVIKDKDGVRNTQNSCPSFMLTLDGRPDEQHGMVIGARWHGAATTVSPSTTTMPTPHASSPASTKTSRNTSSNRKRSLRPPYSPSPSATRARAASAATSTAGRGCTGSTTAASSAASCSTAGKASR